MFFKIIFSDVLNILISFVIDLILLFFVKKKMSIKRSLVFVNPVVSLIFTQFKNKRNISKNKFNTSKNRITTMIILNGVNFLLFKLPLALISFNGFFVKFDSGHMSFSPNLTVYIVCRVFKLCDSLQEFFFFVYLNSFFFQFIILLKLDRNFIEAFKLIKTNFKTDLAKYYKNLASK